MINTNHLTGLKHWGCVQTAHLEFPPTGKVHIWSLDVNLTSVLAYCPIRCLEKSLIQLSKLIKQNLTKGNLSKLIEVKCLVKSIIANQSTGHHFLTTTLQQISDFCPTNVGLCLVCGSSGFHFFFHDWKRAEGWRGWLWVTEKETVSRAMKQTRHKEPGFRLPQRSWVCLGAFPQTWSLARPDFLINFRCSTASVLGFSCGLSNPSFNSGNSRICVREPIMNILLMCRVHPQLNTVCFHDPICFSDTTVPHTGFVLLLFESFLLLNLFGLAKQGLQEMQNSWIIFKSLKIWAL